MPARVEGGAVFWEHRQPATGGRWESAVSLAPRALTELDPLGADLGTESPYEPGITPAEPAISDSRSHWATRAGAAGDPQSGCNATGLALPCELIARMLRDGSAYIPDSHRDPTLPPGWGVIPWVPPGRPTEGAWKTRILYYESIMSPNSSFFTGSQRTLQPPDVEGIGKALENLLKKPDCINFIKALLGKVQSAANQLVREGNIMEIYALINSPKQRGMIRAGAPGSMPGYGMAALGSIHQGTARIQVGTHTPGPPTPELDAPGVLHEIIHHAGEYVYADEVLAKALNELKLPGVKELESPPESLTSQQRAYFFSAYWGDVLNKKCKD